MLQSPISRQSKWLYIHSVYTRTYTQPVITVLLNAFMLLCSIASTHPQNLFILLHWTTESIKQQLPGVLLLSKHVSQSNFLSLLSLVLSFLGQSLFCLDASLGVPLAMFLYCMLSVFPNLHFFCYFLDLCPGSVEMCFPIITPEVGYTRNKKFSLYVPNNILILTSLKDFKWASYGISTIFL